MESTACSFLELLVNFAPVFASAPSIRNFNLLARGWVLCVAGRTISRVLQFGGLGEERRHHSMFYRFFSRAKWDPNELSACLFSLVVRWIPESWPIVLLVDDTLCLKSGAHIWGAGMHHDPLLSNYGRGTSLVKFFSFGHSWVILCACIPKPWNPAAVFAIPVAFRLYRAKKRCPTKDYRKRTELARELVDQVTSWVPAHRTIRLVGDREYACQTLVHGLPRRIVFVGPMPMDAGLYAPVEPNQTRGRGRPRKKGARLPSPQQLRDDDTIAWQPRTLMLYGRTVEVLTKTQTGLWYHVAGTRAVPARVDHAA